LVVAVGARIRARAVREWWGRAIGFARVDGDGATIDPIATSRPTYLLSD
jgi:hypothetical protein